MPVIPTHGSGILIHETLSQKKQATTIKMIQSNRYNIWHIINKPQKYFLLQNPLQSLM